VPLPWVLLLYLDLDMEGLLSEMLTLLLLT